jgi:hypothetical protein
MGLQLQTFIKTQGVPMAIFNTVVTQVDVRDPSIGYDDDGNEYEIYMPDGSYCGYCGKVFDARDEFYGTCVLCTYDEWVPLTT